MWIRRLHGTLTLNLLRQLHQLALNISLMLLAKHGSALSALRTPVGDILPDLTVRAESASLFHLTPRRVPEVQPAKRAKRGEDVPRSDSDAAMGSADRKAAGDSSPSSGSSSSASDSDDSSEDASSAESDLDKLEAAYTEFASLSEGLGNISYERNAVGASRVMMCLVCPFLDLRPC